MRLAGSPHRATHPKAPSQIHLGAFCRVFPQPCPVVGWGLACPLLGREDSSRTTAPHVAFTGRVGAGRWSECGKPDGPSLETFKWAWNTLLGALKSLVLPRPAGTISRVEIGRRAVQRSGRNLLKVKRFRQRRRGSSPQYDTVHGDDEHTQLKERVFVRRDPLREGPQGPRLRALA